MMQWSCTLHSNVVNYMYFVLLTPLHVIVELKGIVKEINWIQCINYYSSY